MFGGAMSDMGFGLSSAVAARKGMNINDHIV